MNDIQIKGQVKDGHFRANNPYDWNTAMKVFDGKDVMLKIGPPKKTRTPPQNKYLFGGPYKQISEVTGQDKDSIHHFFKNMFLTVEDDSGIPKVLSTTKLSTVEFIQYYRQIIQWAAEFLGLYIAEPNEEEMWKLREEIGK